MSSSGLKRFFSKIGLRISLWHSGILIVSGIVLLVLVHFVLSFLFTEKDRDSIRLESQRLSGIYSAGGAEALQREIAGHGHTRTFIRLVSPQGRTMISSDAREFDSYELDRIPSLKPERDGWLKLPEKEAGQGFDLPPSVDVLEIASWRQRDGTMLQVGKTSEERNDLEQSFLYVLGLLMIPLLLAVAAFLSHRALYPLRAMITTVESIQAGELSSRVPTTGTGDELDELAHLFNSMLERIEKLIKAMQDSLDSVAHDLRTPITRLRATAEMALQSNGSVESYHEALADCMEETDQILSMLETLMDISEAQTGAMHLRPERVSVSKLIEDTVDLYHYVAEDRGLVIESSCPEDLFVYVDARRIRQALANLVDNAVKYTEVGGRIVLEARPSDHEAIITVSDTGPGIRSDELPRIWERLYRSSNVQTKKGIGLGLSLVRAIIQSHGGAVEAASEINKGSIFTIHLPLSSTR
jgi:signal transduction histidine kinase